MGKIAKQRARELLEGFFNKAQPTIQTEPNISSLQRRLWNVLTRNAFDSLSERKRHQIPLSVLKMAADISNSEL